MQNLYIVSVNTDAPISVDDRLALKENLGLLVRATLGVDAPVAVDHLDPDDLHVTRVPPA